MPRLGFGPRPELMTLDRASKVNQFIHDAYGPRIDAGTEFFVAIPINRSRHPLAARVIAEGDKGEVKFTFLELMRAVRFPGASHFIIAHNHPSGNPVPSFSDRELMRVLGSKLSSVDPQLWDHVIVTPEPSKYSSWKENPTEWGRRVPSVFFD